MPSKLSSLVARVRAGRVRILWLVLGALLLVSALPIGLYHRQTYGDSGGGLFARYEWPATMGLLCAFGSVRPRTPRLVRALAIYGCGALAAYSIVPYKTPWCIVSLTWPFLLLFGYGVAFGARRFPRTANSLAALTLAASLGETIRLNYFHDTDATEPYVYVQTLPDVDELMEPLGSLVKEDPANYQLVGNIIMDSYHPLPWLLGDFPHINYYGDKASPDKMDADFLLVEESRIDDVENSLREEYFTEDLTLRDAQDPSKLYLSVKKFRPLYPGRAADFVPAAPGDKAE